MSLLEQLVWLFILAIPVACISWTVTKEEVFHEVYQFCSNRSREARSLFARKFFYLLTCEYCFSHYVTALILLLAKYTLLLPGWGGYVIAGFSIVWVANFYMSVYSFLRVDIKKEKVITEKVQGGDPSALPISGK
jgi:hypothetical protein